MSTQKAIIPKIQKTEKPQTSRIRGFSPRIIGMISDEVARTIIARLPSVLSNPRRVKTPKKTVRKIDNGIFLDTSAIIDGRIFDVIELGLLRSEIVIPHSILLELKHIADSQDMVRRERGQRGLTYLEKLKKNRLMKMTILEEEDERETKKPLEVDERLIKLAKFYKGRLITCDYNLEKKAAIEGVSAINVNALANVLKVMAVPGEALHITIAHTGKDKTQGVGYLADGTMIVVENGWDKVGIQIDVVINRVIQTATGRILFAKKL